MKDDAIAQRLGAERVLADRLQDAAERRVHHPEQYEKGDHDDGEHKIIAQDLAADRDAEDLVRDQPEGRLQRVGNLERASVLTPGQPGQLGRQHVEGVGDRERHHGEEDRLHS